MLFLASYGCICDSSYPSREVKVYSNVFFFLNTNNDFWRLFNSILSPGTTFNAELLDQVTIDFKRNCVVLVIANEFVHHMPQLHFQN